jgi:hypothetical protein
MLKTWLIPVSLALLAGPAHADQCAWVEADVAERAKALLDTAPYVIEHCEPCGDRAPGEPTHAKTVEIATPASGFRELHVNGKPVDLAYLFVQTDATHYGNVAALVGCPATGVSPSLQIDRATKHGVLITADDHVAPVVAAHTVPAPPPPEPVSVAPTPMVYVYATTVQSVSWLAVALAAAGGFAAAVWLALMLRRRRDMRPRAADLI